MLRRTHLALVSLLILGGFAAGCGADEPTDPSPLPCSYTLAPAVYRRRAPVPAAQ